MAEPSELPLFAWRARPTALRVDHRPTLWRGAAIAGLVGALLATLAVPPRPRLLWNSSASAPIGLYAVRPLTEPHRGDRVVSRLPRGARILAARRGYLPLGVPVVKRVAGVAGDRICAVDRHIYRDGQPLASRRAADARGRALPQWQGCERLRRGRVLLLTAEAPQSFDGRYFGPTRVRDVVGRAVPLWLP